MFRRLIERLKKIFICSSNSHTRGNQVMDVDISSVRSISRAENKRYSKKSMIGLIKILSNNNFVEIIEIGIHDKDAWNIECSICLENIDYEEDIRFIQPCCGQVYHTECIERWVWENQSCPICHEILVVFNYEEIKD